MPKEFANPSAFQILIEPPYGVANLALPWYFFVSTSFTNTDLTDFPELSVKVKDSTHVSLTPSSHGGKIALIAIESEFLHLSSVTSEHGSVLV